MSTAELLAVLASKLNNPETGPDSTEVQQFLNQHATNPEFARLGRLSVALKRALAPQPGQAPVELRRAVTPDLTHPQAVPPDDEFGDGID